MKDERKNKILTQMIREALDKMLFLSEDDDEPGGDPQLSWLQGQGAQEIDDRRPGGYQDEEMHKPWDDRLKELSHLLAGISLDVIDHYKGKPGFTREAAKKEILETVGVALDVLKTSIDVFHGELPEFGEFYSLDQIIDEEFQDMNEDKGSEPVAVDINDDDEDPDTISENNIKNREND